MMVSALSPRGWDLECVFCTVTPSSAWIQFQLPTGVPGSLPQPPTSLQPFLNFLHRNHLYSHPCLELYLGGHRNQDHLRSKRKMGTPDLVSFYWSFMVTVQIVKFE